MKGFASSNLISCHFLGESNAASLHLVTVFQLVSFVRIRPHPLGHDDPASVFMLTFQYNFRPLLNVLINTSLTNLIYGYSGFGTFWLKNLKMNLNY